MTDTTPDYGETFISLADAEALAIGTGDWRGTAVEFSNDGITWADHWLPTPDGGDDQHPQLARATVKRRFGGDVVETTVIVRWDEYFPAGTESALRWLAMPTIMLRKVAVVFAIRTAFRDVIGNRHERAEMDQADATPSAVPAAARDWLAEVLTAKTPGEVAALHTEAKSARAITPNAAGIALEQALKARRRELEQEIVEVQRLTEPASEALLAPTLDPLVVAALAGEAAIAGSDDAAPKREAPKPGPPKARRQSKSRTTVEAAWDDAKAKSEGQAR